jgi:hypothetical protein
VSRRSAVPLLCDDSPEILGGLAAVTSKLLIEVPLVAVGRLSRPLFRPGSLASYFSAFASRSIITLLQRHTTQASAIN